MAEYFKTLIEATGLTVEQYQKKYAEDINQTLRLEHNRDVDPNGVIGPHTAAHIMQRKCGVDDTAAAEEARIPPACQSEYRIHIDWSGFNPATMGISREDARGLFLRAFDDWLRAIGIAFKLVEQAANAHCTIDFALLSGSTLAWSHLANNTCNRGQQQRYDIRRWTMHMLYLTILHELGHLLGLPHRSGMFVMNPSILTQLEGLTQQDIRDAIALGYPGGSPDPDPGPQPPAPRGNSAGGVLDVTIGGTTVQFWIVGAPKVG